ncbi:MAG: class I SAM-dependent methyltransferase [Nitrospirota bacterium]
MDPLGKQELLNFHNRHLRDFGDTPQAVRWTPEGQMRRYETLLMATGDLSGKTILDFGCGKGDLYGFLRDKGVAVAYCGIDVNDNLIELAQHKYPQAEFIALDIDEDTFHRRFDVIIGIGVFNLRIAGIEESMKGLLKNLFPFQNEDIFPRKGKMHYYISWNKEHFRRGMFVVMVICNAQCCLPIHNSN